MEESLESLDEDTEYDLAYSVVAGKLAKIKKDDPTLRNKLGSLLRRRGFSWETITRVIDALCPDGK